MIRTLYSLVTAMLLITLSACSGANKVAEQRALLGESADADAQTYVFTCEDDFRFTARIQNDTAWLFLRRGTLRLSAVDSPAGEKYQDGQNTFWIKGNEASLSGQKRTHKNCKNDRRKAIWEHAKLNGVDFRAVGNEPGWVLEISNKTDILFLADYGQSRHTFTGAEVSSATQMVTTIYEGNNEADHIEVTITRTRCGDTMSGEKFPLTVSVRLNETVYRGCGKALH